MLPFYCSGVAVVAYGDGTSIAHFIRVHHGLGSKNLALASPFAIIGLLFVSAQSDAAIASGYHHRTLDQLYSRASTIAFLAVYFLLDVADRSIFFLPTGPRGISSSFFLAQ